MQEWSIPSTLYIPLSFPPDQEEDNSIDAKESNHNKNWQDVI